MLLLVPRRLRFKKDVSEDIVLVTGAGSGIGRSLALRFAREGCVVVTWDINPVANEETCLLARKNGGRCEAYVVDVADRLAVYRTAELVKKEVGKVTILINNAGIVAGKHLMDLPDSGIENLFRVNTLALFWTCRAFLPDMKEMNKGHVVNIASLAGLFGLEKLTDYCATKHAIIGFSKALMLEFRYGGHDIHVTTVCPGLISTGLFEGFNMGLVPVLRPEKVAEEVMTSVKLNEAMVILPRFLNLLLVSQGILPGEAFTVLSEIFGSSEAMKNFRGRTSGSKNGGHKNGTNGVSKLTADTVKRD